MSASTESDTTTAGSTADGSSTIASVPSSGHGDAEGPGYVDHGDKDKVLARLRRIEGQVRGIQRMVDNEDYCIDVLTQVSAATRALQNVALLLLDDHVRHCVAHDVRTGSEDKIDEAMEAVARLVRS